MYKPNCLYLTTKGNQYGNFFSANNLNRLVIVLSVDPMADIIQYYYLGNVGTSDFEIHDRRYSRFVKGELLKLICEVKND
jgi:hypothetical protein